MAGTLLLFKPQLFTNAGAPGDGLLAFVYLAGTSTKADIYSDADLTTPLSNPAVCDSSGRVAAFVDAGTYDVVLAPADDTDPPTSPIYTLEGVAQIPPPYTGISILAAGYSGSASQTASVDVNLLNDNDSAVCEWKTDYSSSTLSARAIVAATNYDLGTAAASTATGAKAVLTRLSSTSLRVELTVWQDTSGVQVKFSGTTATVADMNANAVTVQMGMASGTYTIRGYSILHVPTP